MLDTASVGLMPSPVYESLQKLLEAVCSGELGVEDLEEYVVKARREVSRLVGGDLHEVTFTVQTTEGLKNVLGAFDLRPGDSVLALDLESPTITSLVKSLCEVRGCRVKVAGSMGIYETGDLEKPDDSVKVAVVSSVQWITGWRIDLRESSRESSTSMEPF
ncbi:aminotransferase class V-fold PLP-dependent enzyme [Thermogladius calderae]|uniref:aminotransferase class V-fold PLP-dependent enzyme n=1 Tax=Thermogladius calderae TaxID=1200300 RepID=UPI002368090A|nr:aminotransferase class V-fold PLP-dependent enzyme [Thermogladius calderae]